MTYSLRPICLISCIIIVMVMVMTPIMGLEKDCGAQNMYFELINKAGFDSAENRLASIPVIKEPYLYLYTCWENQKNYHLWQARLDELPIDNISQLDPNNMKSIWKDLDLTFSDMINDPNALTITSLGVYQDNLFLAVKTDKPELWRLEDPNEISWTSVGSQEFSGSIDRLYVYNNYLYISLKDTQATSDDKKISLWRSTASGSQTITSSTWVSIDCGQLTQNKNTMITDLEEFNQKLYLSTENSQTGGEVWIITENGSDIDLNKDDSWEEGYDKIAAMAVSDHLLYLVSQDLDSGVKTSAQVWFYQSSPWEKSSWEEDDPNLSVPLSLKSLGSYLFLGFDNEGKEIWRANAGKEWELYNQSQWKGIKAVDATDEDEQLLFDGNNNFSWLQPDPNNGYLYLGVENKNEGFKIWRSNQLPIITISSPTEGSKNLFDPGPAFDTFNNDFSLNWKTTKTGYYFLRLVEFTDPNHHPIDHPNPKTLTRLIDKPNAVCPVTKNSSVLTSHLMEGEGIYRGEIRWDPNQEPLAKDKEAYPVRFSFIYDITPPSVPALIEVLPGNEKLQVQWTMAEDKLSGVAKYKIFAKEISAGEDPNNIIFTEEEIIDETKGDETEYIIENLNNGRRYLIAVSALDQADNESGYSLPLKGTPEKGQGLTDLFGETGGCFLSRLKPKRKNQRFKYYDR